MKVATVSFNSIWEDKEANLIQFERIVKSLKLKVEIVIFPEMTFTGF
jgi:predicted amidohydrolase